MVNAMILGYDITSKESYNEMKYYWYNECKDINETDLINLIANKCDLYDKEQVNEMESRNYAKENGMRFFMISCKNESKIRVFINDLTAELIKR